MGKHPVTNTKVLGATTNYVFGPTLGGCLLTHRTKYIKLLVHDHINKRVVKLLPQYNVCDTTIKPTPLLILLDHKDPTK